VLDHAKWLAAIKAGRTFATNGPLIELTLGEREIGEVVALNRPGTLEARVALHSIVPVDHLQLVGNGVVVAEIPLAGERTEATATVPLKIARSGWYLARAFADRSRHPVLDSFPIATTSPIYVDVGGGPVRSASDVEYFVAWIDRLAAGARSHPGYDSDAEKAAVLKSLADAKQAFLDRAR
jgi:hypothetical protein